MVDGWSGRLVVLRRMQPAEGRTPAPDLFTALGLVPFSGGESRSTPVSEPNPPTAVPPSEVADEGPPSSGLAGGSYSGLADLLEPGAGDEQPTTPMPKPVAAAPAEIGNTEIDLENDVTPPTGARPSSASATPAIPTPSQPDEPATSASASFPAPGRGGSGPLPVLDPGAAPSLEVAVATADAAIDSISDDVPAAGLAPAAAPLGPAHDEDVFVRRTSVWPWAALSMMLAAGLGWVLWTQTDLFAGGSLIERRDQAVAAEVAAEAAAIEEERQRNAKEYGTLTLDSAPEGARVWMVKEGPEATFEHLPVDNEYQVLVTAPGHASRVRVVKGSELGAPVIMDLDPLEDPRARPPIPDAPPPELGDGDSDETATLRLRSNSEGARLALLVGYTPGVKIVDLDVEQVHTVWLTLAGHALHEIVLKGRHWEETSDGALVYMEHVKLEPQPETAVADTDGSESVTQTGGDLVIEEEKPVPRRKRKRRRRKKRRR